MLKRFRVSNFKNHLNTEFRPAGVNLLIGPNNAGKTNLCLAMRFLGLTSTRPLEIALVEAVGETWNIVNAYVSDKTIEMEAECSLPHQGEQLLFSYDLQIAVQPGGPQIARQPFKVVKETLTLQGGGFDGIPLLVNDGEKAKLLNEEHWVRKEQNPYIEAPVPTGATLLCVLYDLPTYQRANLFKRYLQSWAYFDFNPKSLGSSIVKREQYGLLHDGTNFGRALFILHNMNPSLERSIIKVIRDLEPKLEHIIYISPDPEHIYFYIEDQERKRFSAEIISDGTFRFMAMTFVIFSTASAVEDGLTPPLVMIEEPENGLYVGHLKPLVERIDRSGQAGQFIFTTHSPYFIDLFDDNPEGLHLLKPGKPSCSLKKPDPETIRNLLEKMPLGELHFREMLG